MDSFSARRIYAVCERIGPGFWDEPFNALTNAAFLLAALVAFRQWRAAGARDVPLLLLIVNVAVIGIGSFLFHSFATRWALTLDTVPIQAFILGALLLALLRLVGLPWLLLAPALAVLWFAGSVWRDLVPPEWGWRWRTYGVALLLLGIVTLAVTARGLLRTGSAGATARRAAAALAMALVVFTVSLVLATNDRAWCDSFAVSGYRFGTHPLWHLLNAVTCGLVVRALAQRTHAAQRQNDSPNPTDPPSALLPSRNRATTRARSTGTLVAPKSSSPPRPS